MKAYDEEKMKALIEADDFLKFIKARMMKTPGETEAHVLKVIFNTYVLGDSIMEFHYSK